MRPFWWTIEKPQDVSTAKRLLTIYFKYKFKYIFLQYFLKYTQSKKVTLFLSVDHLLTRPPKGGVILLSRGKLRCLWRGETFIAMPHHSLRWPFLEWGSQRSEMDWLCSVCHGQMTVKCFAWVIATVENSRMNLFYSLSPDNQCINSILKP